MGVVDELDETLTSEQRRLLCLALQHQQEYDEDYEPSFDNLVCGPPAPYPYRPP